ncbi:MAG: dihydrofolate reductase family protein [Sulfobacillus sp.]
MQSTRKLVLYIAQSLDGYIAREDESLDWLLKYENHGDNGYAAFYETVGTLLLGRRTYEWILRNVPSEFPYPGKECYVFSRSLSGRTDRVTFVNQDIARFTAALKTQPGQDIWIVGGAEVLSPLLRDNLVDELIIHIAPTIIGGGIPLFKAGMRETSLDLVKVTQYHQFVELRYQYNHPDFSANEAP